MTYKASVVAKVKAKPKDPRRKLANAASLLSVYPASTPCCRVVTQMWPQVAGSQPRVAARWLQFCCLLHSPGHDHKTQPGHNQIFARKLNVHSFLSNYHLTTFLVLHSLHYLNLTILTDSSYRTVYIPVNICYRQSLCFKKCLKLFFNHSSSRNIHDLYIKMK